MSDPGEYRVVLSAKDRTGRVTDQFLTDLGGTTEKTILTQAPSPTVCLPPLILLGSTGQNHGAVWRAILNCATASATIHYQIKPKNTASDGSWTTYSGPINYTRKTQVVYAYASKGGLTDSEIVMSN